MFENDLVFYSRPTDKNKIIKKFNENLYLVEQTNVITGSSRNDILLSTEDIQENINNQDKIIKVIEKAIQFDKDQKELKQREEAQLQLEQEEYENVYGYCDNMTQLQQGKSLKVLNKNVMIDSKYMTRKEFIYNKIKEGYEPKIIDKIMTSQRKINLERKETYKYNVPVIESKDGFYTITKTEYNFALYLLENVLQPI